MHIMTWRQQYTVCMSWVAVWLPWYRRYIPTWYAHTWYFWWAFQLVGETILRKIKQTKKSQHRRWIKTTVHTVDHHQRQDAHSAYCRRISCGRSRSQAKLVPRKPRERIRNTPWSVNPFRTPVPFWGQTTWSLNGLSPKRDCGISGMSIDGKSQ